MISLREQTMTENNNEELEKELENVRFFYNNAKFNFWLFQEINKLNRGLNKIYEKLERIQ